MNLYLVLTETPPDPHQPDGGVVLAGLFYSEDELAYLPDGSHAVYVGERDSESALPETFKLREKRSTKTPKTRVKVEEAGGG